MTSRRCVATAVRTIPISDPVLWTILDLTEGRPSVYIYKKLTSSHRDATVVCTNLISVMDHPGS